MATLESREEAALPDLDRALNTAGFSEFLIKAGREIPPDSDHAEEILEQFEIFENISRATERVKAFYRRAFHESHRVRFSSGDLESIGEEIERKTLQNPEYALGLLSTIEAHEEARREVERTEDRIEKLTGKPLDELEDFRNAAETVRQGGLKTRLSVLGYFFRNEKEEDAVRLLEESGGSSISKGLKNMAKVEEAEAHIAEHADAINYNRNLIFSEFAVTGALFETAKAKILERLMPSADENTSLPEMERLHKYADHLDRKNYDRDLDRFSRLNELGLLPALQGALERKVTREVERIIGSMELGENALTKLEKALRRIERQKLGGRSEAETRAFFEEAIRNAAERVTDPAKKIIINRMYIKKFDPETAA